MTRPHTLLLTLLVVACHTRTADSAAPTPVGSVAMTTAGIPAAIIDSAGHRIGQAIVSGVLAGVQTE